jgi:flagellin-like hook-associated protein FlgL
MTDLTGAAGGYKMELATQAAGSGWDAASKAGVNISAAIGQLDTLTTKLRSAAATFGTDNAILDTRREFTENLVNTLESGAGELVNADMNEESANMLSLQTRQQLGTISLSIANQAEQSVLRLF